MIYIKSFKNYDEFKKIFAIVEHGNGVKSRKNKILLAWLKDRNFLHRWLQWREKFGENIFFDNAERHCYLAAKDMNEMRTAVQEIMCNAAPCVNNNLSGKFGNRSRLAGWEMYHNTLHIDKNDGLCADGDTKSVRYVNTERDNRVFKMKAGKFVTACLEDMPCTDTLPEQVKRWIGEEFARDWQAHAEKEIGGRDSLTLYVGSDTSDFRYIYDYEEYSGDFHSCMAGEDQYEFYREAVDASAACLTNREGKIVARCVIFNDVRDEDGKVWRLAERQYSTDQNDVLKQILVNKLIDEGLIDGYKRVGVDCHDNRNFVANNGESLAGKQFCIDCDLNEDDILSYQDSFVYYDRRKRIAYNYAPDEYTDELNVTDKYFVGNHDGEEYSEYSGEWIDSGDAVWDEYHEDWMRNEDAEEAYYHGRNIKIHCNRTEDFTWTERYDMYLFDDDCVTDADGEVILREDAIECVDGEYYHGDDTYYSDILGDYVPCAASVYSDYHKDYLYESEAFFSETLDDWFVSEEEMLKAEREHELVEETA
jgi:hypothetical protein